MTGIHRRWGLALASAALILVTASSPEAWGQPELLPLEHPATRLLVRLSEYGAAPSFPREHLPVSRQRAREALTAALTDEQLPPTLVEAIRYELVDLTADSLPAARAVFIATGPGDVTVYDEPLASRPLAVLQWSEPESRLRLVLEPVLDAEVRSNPVDGAIAVIGQAGLHLRGSVLGTIGFSARVTNGSVAGDSAIAARDPRISRAGAFGIAGFGRDIDFATGHVRGDWGPVFVEIAREAVQLGVGLSRGLLLGSTVPSTYDYLRFGLAIGPITFTHLHGSLLPDIGKEVRGAGSQIPSKYIATHLLTARISNWLRLSLGESVIYSGRPFEIGYLNPFAFIRSQEHTYRDRDNANMYAAVAATPFRGLQIEGEFMLDDLRFSRIGEGYWSNKTAFRVGVSTRALAGSLDLGLSYTRLEPYMYSHFKDTNAYTHDGSTLAAGGLQPNSHLLRVTAEYHPLPFLAVRAEAGLGEHGANVMDADTVLRNVGGDIRLTRRYPVDSDTVRFLDGVVEQIEMLRAEVEYTPLRNVNVHLTGVVNIIGGEALREIRLGLRIGAR